MARKVKVLSAKPHKCSSVKGVAFQSSNTIFPYSTFPWLTSLPRDPLTIASHLGNPYVPVEKSKWTAASSGYYKNSNSWKPSNAVDGKHNTLYATSTYDIYHWIQVDFGKTVSVSATVTTDGFCLR